MAEVTKPIALDESFNTTEATPRNIADVLADALGSGNTLSGLNDVVINSVTLSNNQTLMYDSVAGKWVNADGVRTWQGTQAEYNAIPSPDPAVTYYITDSTSVSIGLDDLTNVSTVGVSNGEFLYYDDGTWKNIDITAQIGDPNGNISDSYDPTATYNTGSVCIYDNVLYICTADNITGTFDPSKWTATTIDNIVGDLSSLTTTDKSSLVGAVNEVNGAITSPKDITSDYITIASGYTFVSGKVYKQGKHIFGNIVLSGTLQGGNNTDTLGTIKSDYRTADPINGFCGISNGQWFTNNIGYVYIATSGGLQVATPPTGMNYAKIHIDYVTA